MNSLFHNGDRPLSDVYTVPVSNSSAVRVYSDTRPHNWKIADLQKGLVLIHNGKETVGEGTGFGLPVLIYSRETFFSTTSKVCVSQTKNSWTIHKEFIMDRVARNKFRNVTLENRKARIFIKCLADLYQKHPQFRFLVLKKVTRRMNIDTTFEEVASAGVISVDYTIENRRILVEADFRRINKTGLRKIFMLNEQGSRFFRRYADSQGLKLEDPEIGAWDQVEGDWAKLEVLKGDFGFCLWKADDGVLRRGREFLNGSLDWVGLDFEVNPKNAFFDYLIEILEE